MTEFKQSNGKLTEQEFKSSNGRKLDPKGKEIADLVRGWVDKNLHPDDFDSMFANELLETLDTDKGR